ncbi:hypothetical protein FZEAL_10219 [Fusarium zealandicum]|uniref:Uncharacterized protein n=1 Tax=Fusarium zealandicum TaxID=1053134 RepID=A0A8H4XBY7_9HYPO|nr:hypothetical protein FZEAL_10219 [Fusarium zealandicum]
MAPAPTLQPRQAYIPKDVPVGGNVMSLIVSLAAVTVLSAFLSQRIIAVRAWRRIPFVVWLVFAIYVDSYLFVFVTAILQQVFGVNSSFGICHGAILLCLVCYVTTKILIYVFLVEKAYIIRSTAVKRSQSKLYLFNMITLLGGYTIVVILNFVFRIARIVNGECFIGMRSVSMIPLISFDAVVNVYLTILFLIPLKNLYSFKNMPKTNATIRLRMIAFRTFVGACCTLTSSIVYVFRIIRIGFIANTGLRNLTVLMVLDGEPGWVCLMCCNIDILFSAIVIQWITNRDNAGSSSQPASAVGMDSRTAQRRQSLAHPLSARRNPPSPHDTDAEISLVASATAHSSSEDSPPTELAKISTGSGVMVTTTIHRQSVPTSGFGLDMSSGNGGNGIRPVTDETVYGFPPRPMSFAVDHNEVAEPPQTHITGGCK